MGLLRGNPAVYRPVFGHSLPEWLSGRGFFSTEEKRGPRWATEKKAVSADEAPQAVLKAKCVDVKQQTDRKAAHAQ